MCNPEFDYCNVEEKWAVRINNNGEFIHENPLTTPYLGKENVSHGCVNMGVGDAEEYYNSAIYGDPVEVTNTGVPMTREGLHLRLDLLLRRLAEAVRAVATRTPGPHRPLPRRTGRAYRCGDMGRHSAIEDGDGPPDGVAGQRHRRHPPARRDLACTPRRWPSPAPATPAG